MAKQTVLDEDAIIYQPREKLTEKEKLGDMNFHDKVVYLWSYYKIHAIITIAVIALATYIIHNIVTPNVVTQFSVAMIDNAVPDEVIAEYKSEFATRLQLDPKLEDLDFNSSFYFNGSADYSSNMQSVLSTYVAASEIDVIIAPESEMANYAYYGFLDKLSDQLPTDIYATMTDNFYFSDQEEDSEQNAYGIYLTDTKMYQDYTNADDPFVIGIVTNSKHKTNAVEFIRFLFGE
jgi:hypothetical protein